MKKVAFHTLGCKVNQYETEAMIEAFEQSGYEVVPYEEFSDVYIINTCTVTNLGDRKSRQIIRRVIDINPDAFIAVVGCYAQMAPDKVMDIPGVKLVLGTNDRARIVELVEYAMQKEEAVNMVTDIMKVKDFEEMKIENYKSRTRAFVKIQEGCEQYCSYCIIPYARGRVRSRRPESIIEEVKRLADSGFKEVVLTGIHTGSYGKDLEGISLIDIVEMVHTIDGIERVRMGSVEPNTLSDNFIGRISNMPKACRHFHLSLQSGCDETLKRMNRKYTTFEYKSVVEKLRAVFPDVAITTDLIVGFPGETQEEFNKTVKFIDDIAFSDMHIFKFSPRTGTPAAKHKDQVDPKIKDERSKIVAELAARNSHNFKKNFLGRELKVLYEQKINEENLFEGLTDNYIKVIAKAAYDIKGNIVNTLMEEIETDHMSGKIIK